MDKVFNIELAKELKSALYAKSDNEIYGIVQEYAKKDQYTTMIYMYWSTDFNRTKLAKALGYNVDVNNYLLRNGLITPQECSVKCIACKETFNVLVHHKTELNDLRKMYVCDSCQATEQDVVSVPKKSKELYQGYLNSAHWTTIKNIALDISGNKCQLCSSTKDLNVHHNNYDNLGKETTKDVIVIV